jgi:hypothetical protein
MWSSRKKELDRLSNHDADASTLLMAPISLTEHRARTLAPTIFCPESRVDECITEAQSQASV